MFLLCLSYWHYCYRRHYGRYHSPFNRNKSKYQLDGCQLQSSFGSFLVSAAVMATPDGLSSGCDLLNLNVGVDSGVSQEMALMRPLRSAASIGLSGTS